MASVSSVTGYPSCLKQYQSTHFWISMSSAILKHGIIKHITHAHTHTHTRLTALCPGLPGWAGTRKVKPIWILLKQQTVSGSGISWTICKSAPHSRQITMPAPHHWSFLQAGCPSCRPTKSVKALKAQHVNVTKTADSKLARLSSHTWCAWCRWHNWIVFSIFWQQPSYPDSTR